MSVEPVGLATGTAAAVAMVALYTDARQRVIPHWIVGGLGALWVVGALLADQPLNGAARESLACGAAGFALGYGFHRLGWLGGGDGKLLGVLALWLGLHDVGLWLLSTAVLGLALAAVALIHRRGDFAARGIPFAWAMVPPASALLFARAFSPGT